MHSTYRYRCLFVAVFFLAWPGQAGAQTPDAYACGNSMCEPWENCSNCPEDCCFPDAGAWPDAPAPCGNGVCEANETCERCPADCGSCATPDAASPVCTLNSDCPTGQYCGTNSNCTFDCRSSDDCAADSVCTIDGQCTVTDESGCGCVVAGGQRRVPLAAAMVGLLAALVLRPRRGRAAKR